VAFEHQVGESVDFGDRGAKASSLGTPMHMTPVDLDSVRGTRVPPEKP
jgi:hypothetical protein